MRAGAGEVQVAIPRVTVVRAKIRQLSQVVTQPVRGALQQVVALAPGERIVGDLELDMPLQVTYTQQPQPAKDLAAGLVAERLPILITVAAFRCPTGTMAISVSSPAGAIEGSSLPRRMDVQTGIPRAARGHG